MDNKHGSQYAFKTKKRKNAGRYRPKRYKTEEAEKGKTFKLSNLTLIQGLICAVILAAAVFIKNSGSESVSGIRKEIRKTLDTSTDYAAVETFVFGAREKCEEAVKNAAEVFGFVNADVETDGEKTSKEIALGDASSSLSSEIGEASPANAEEEAFFLDPGIKQSARDVYVTSLEQEEKMDSSYVNAGAGEEQIKSIPADASMKYVETSVEFDNPLKGRLTCEFGYRIHPISGKESFHYGIDIGAPGGRSIKAPAGGTVSKIGESSVYGKYLIITHGDGMSTFYGHCSQITVSKGECVKRGDVIAKVGSTGYSTGNHLHFEIRSGGIRLNPLNYVEY